MAENLRAINYLKQLAGEQSPSSREAALSLRQAVEMCKLAKEADSTAAHFTAMGVVRR